MLTEMSAKRIVLGVDTNLYKKGAKMTNIELLRKRIEESGLKLSFIAAKLGISRANFYEKLANRSQFNQFQIEAICRLLNISDPAEMKEIFFAD